MAAKTYQIPLRVADQEAQINIEQQADGYTEGDKATFSVQISDAMVRLYANQYGDANPIHLDEEAGKASVFKSRVAHGALSFNFFSTILGVGFPGPGTIFMSVEEWKFTAPVLIDEKIDFEVVAESVHAKSKGVIIKFRAVARNSAGKPVMSGLMTVMAPKLKSIVESP